VRFPGKENSWLFRFSQLVEGREKFGSAGNFRIWKDDKGLNQWVSSQRSQRKQLRPHRRRLLDEIGFVWTPMEDNWERHFEELLAFKVRFGHALVPDRWPENPKLGRWLMWQRMITRRHPEKRKRLEEAGCFLRYTDLIWEKRFAQ
jgi:hypothetical protein